MWWSFRQLENRVCENRSVCLIWFRSTFVVTFTFTRVQKPKCSIKLMTKAGIYGFWSSPGYDSQQQDISFVSHLQSIAWSKPKLLLRKQRVPSWLHSPSHECKKRSFLSSWWLKLGSTAFGPPRAIIVNNEIVTSYHIRSLKSLSDSQIKITLSLHSQSSLIRKPEHNFDNRRDQSPNDIHYHKWEWKQKTTIKLKDKG